VVAARAVQAQLADLVRKSVYIVLDNQGVVRRIENLGVKTLPYPMRAHMTKFDVGRYAAVVVDPPIPARRAPTNPPPALDAARHGSRTLLIRFDARPALAAELSRQLRNDDRVIRHTIFKRPKDEQLGIVKNEGISPLEALMNPNSLLGSLGDLSGLLDTPSTASSASSSTSLFGALPSFSSGSSGNSNSAAGGTAANEGAPAAGSAGASGSSLASWRRGWQPTTPSSRYGRGTAAAAANGTDALASLSSLLTKRAAEGKTPEAPADAPSPATPVGKP